MAVGFSTGASFGNRQVVPDKGLSTTNTPRVHIAKFGDGYEQRVQDGINSLEQEFSLSFATRPKAEIDDIIGFFESKAGATSFNYTVDDTNESGNELTVKVVCSSWNQTWAYDNFYSATATFRRVYEA
jgi:phage-related protein